VSEPLAIVTALIVERPHCFSCLSEKAGLTTGELQEVIARIGGTFVVHSARDRCHVCGTVTDVISLRRRSS
jgi:hypothetical protein